MGLGPKLRQLLFQCRRFDQYKVIFRVNDKHQIYMKISKLKFSTPYNPPKSLLRQFFRKKFFNGFPWTWCRFFMSINDSCQYMSIYLNSFSVIYLSSLFYIYIIFLPFLDISAVSWTAVIWPRTRKMYKKSLKNIKEFFLKK